MSDRADPLPPWVHRAAELCSAWTGEGARPYVAWRSISPRMLSFFVGVPVMQQFYQRLIQTGADRGALLCASDIADMDFHAGGGWPQVTVWRGRDRAHFVPARGVLPLFFGGFGVGFSLLRYGLLDGIEQRVRILIRWYRDQAVRPTSIGHW